jgi:5-methylcytosine-specific restriction endonuclease McrA
MLDILIPGWRHVVHKRIVSGIIQRNEIEVSAWRKSVLSRDNYTCVDCGSTESLHAHHILPWSEYPELRIEVENGETLCGDCHSNKHPKMGKAMFIK